MSSRRSSFRSRSTKNKEHEEKAAEQQAAKPDTQELISDATAQAIAQTPVALLGALATMPGGASGALSAARLLVRNWPLVLLRVMIAAVVWPTEHAPAEEEGMVGRKPNGSDDHMPSALRH